MQTAENPRERHLDRGPALIGQHPVVVACCLLDQTVQLAAADGKPQGRFADFGLSDTVYSVRDISTDGQKLILDVKPSQDVYRYLNRMYIPFHFVFKGKRYFIDSPYAGTKGETVNVVAVPPARVVIDHGTLHLNLNSLIVG